MATGDASAALARALHEDGFVALDEEEYALTKEELAGVLAAVRRRYDQYTAVATAREIDLSHEANSERIPGFYVRKGGRIDMQLMSVVAQSALPLPDALAAGKVLISDVEPIDFAVLRGLEAHWKPVVDAVFAEKTDDPAAQKGENYRLEYVGCVVARPGDEDQNWHLDGVHRNLTKHEPADRINVFVPLVDITPAMGGTEMKRRSQFHDDGRRGTSFEDYAELESVTHYVAAGTPVLMDYRVWHRGRANGSQVLRPLLYFKYTRKPDDVKPAKRAAAETAAASGLPVKKKKRVVLTTVPAS